MTAGGADGMAAALAVLDEFGSVEAPDPTAPKDPRLAPASAVVRTLYADGRAVEKFAAAAATIPELPLGAQLHLVHHGGFSLDTMIARCLELAGPSHFRAATWGINSDSILRFADLASAGVLKSAKFLLDWRTLSFKEVPVGILTQTFGPDSVRMLECHAKAYWLTSDTHDLTLIGSANLTDNPRIEIFTITEGREIGDFWRRWFARAWGRARQMSEERVRVLAGIVDAHAARKGEGRTLVILRGPPGSGKSTWAERNLPEIRFTISREIFHTNPITGVYRYEPEAGQRYHRWHFQRLRQAIRERQSTIVIDNTNAEARKLKGMIARCLSAGYRVRIVRFDTPPDVCVARQTHGAPEDVVRSIAAAMEPIEGEEVIQWQP